MPADPRERQWRDLIKQLGASKADQDVALERLGQLVQPGIGAWAWRRGLEVKPVSSQMKQMVELVAMTVRNRRQPPEGHSDHWSYWLDGLGDVAFDLAVQAGELSLSWCAPDNDPFEFHTNAQWFERVQETARLLSRADFLTQDPPTVTHLSHPDVEILMVIVGRTAAAWVGHLTFGLAVEIDRKTLDVVGRSESPAFQTAAGLAAAWYVDVSFPDRRGIPGLTNRSVHQWNGVKYETGSAFERQISEVRGGRDPAFAHWVVSHIRTLSSGEPDSAHVAMAPTHLRPQMGSSDTWVRGHVRQGAHLDALLNHLLGSPAIADAIGSGFLKR